MVLFISLFAAGLAVVAGLLVLRALPRAGASSPKEAVRRLATAVNEKDGMGILGVLVPAEVRPLRELWDQSSDRATELDAVQREGPADGFTMNVRRLRLRVEPLSSEVAKVHLEDGDLAYRFDLSSLGPRLRPDRAEVFDEEHSIPELAEDIRSGDAEPISGLYVMTVKRDGRWFVSPLYTLAEYLRDTGDVPVQPRLEGPRSPQGAETPREAFRFLIVTALSLDFEQLVRMFPPDELAVAYDYRNAFVAQLEDEARRPLAEERRSFDITLSSMDLREEPLGEDRVKVFLEELEATFHDREGGGTVDIEVSGSCVRTTGRAGTETGCLRESLGEFPEFDPGEAFVVVVRGESGWNVSALWTLAEYGREALGRVRAEHVDRIRRQLAALEAQGPRSRAAQSALRNTLTAAKTIFTDREDYRDATAQRLSRAEPSLRLVVGDRPSTAPDVVSVFPLSPSEFVAAAYDGSATCFFIRDNVRGPGTTMGQIPSDSSGCTADRYREVPFRGSW